MRAQDEMNLARLIFRRWCEAHGIVMDPIAAADLVNRIASALAHRAPAPETPRERNRRRIRAVSTGSVSA